MHNAALSINDVQKAIEDEKWGLRNNPEAELNIRKILKYWREINWPVIHVQHRSDNTSSVFYQEGRGFEIKEIVKLIDGVSNLNEFNLPF